MTSIILRRILHLNLKATFPWRGRETERLSIGIFSLRSRISMSSSLATPTTETSEASGRILRGVDKKRKEKREVNFEKLRIGLRAFKGIHGDMLVPFRFIIPSNTSKWPEEVWDMKLGGTVSNIRNIGQYKEYHDELRDMGFAFDPQRPAFDTVKLGLETYKGIHGDMLVPQHFVIPSNTSKWREEIWGMKLGSTVSNIRNRGEYKKYHDELRDMGFVFDSQVRRDFDLVKLGLETYKGIHGDILVKYGFVIPSNTSEWPEDVWGMNLGSSVNKIRNGGSYKEYHDELREMGFAFDSQLSLDFALVQLGLETYKGIHGDLRVPSGFVIPSNSSEWPEEVWGNKLGYTVNKIRNSGAYKEYRKELREMGFDFNCKATKSLS